MFLIGLLLAQYTITGYDASAHMTEETHDADVAGPNGIWKSIVISVIFGYILLLGVWYAMQGQAGYDAALAFQLATGNIAAPAEIFLDSFGKSLRDLRADHRDGRAVLLRHGVGHDELAHDLRVLPRRRGARSPVVALDQQADPHPNQRASGSPPCWPGCWSRPRTGSGRSSPTSR